MAVIDKLSYRKQIACKLQAQYVDDICSNSVTWKCGLGVTEGHHSIVTGGRVQVW